MIKAKSGTNTHEILKGGVENVIKQALVRKSLDNVTAIVVSFVNLEYKSSSFEINDIRPISKHEIKMSEPRPISRHEPKLSLNTKADYFGNENLTTGVTSTLTSPTNNYYIPFTTSLSAGATPSNNSQVQNQSRQLTNSFSIGNSYDSFRLKTPTGNKPTTPTSGQSNKPESRDKKTNSVAGLPKLGPYGKYYK